MMPMAEIIWRTCGEIRLASTIRPANWATSPIQSSSFLRLAIFPRDSRTKDANNEGSDQHDYVDGMKEAPTAAFATCLNGRTRGQSYLLPAGISSIQPRNHLPACGQHETDYRGLI